MNICFFSLYSLGNEDNAVVPTKLCSISTDDCEKSYMADESSSDRSSDWSIPSVDYTEELKLLYAGIGSMELKKK